MNLLSTLWQRRRVRRALERERQRLASLPTWATFDVALLTSGETCSPATVTFVRDDLWGRIFNPEPYDMGGRAVVVKGIVLAGQVRPVTPQTALLPGDSLKVSVASPFGVELIEISCSN